MATALPRPFLSLAELPAISSSTLKNRFGEAVQQAQGGAVAIQRHHRTEFVLVDASQYEHLLRSQGVMLDALGEKFDLMVAKMNTPPARRAVAQLFGATPGALGKAAVRAGLRNRGR